MFYGLWKIRTSMINKTHDKHMLMWRTLCHNHMLQGAEKNDNTSSSFKIVCYTLTPVGGWLMLTEINRKKRKKVFQRFLSQCGFGHLQCPCVRMSRERSKKGGPLLECNFTVRRPLNGFCLGIAKSWLSVTKCRQVFLSARVGVACRLSLCDTLQEDQEKIFQVKSNKFLELPRNFVFMTISGSHPCCFDYGTFLSRFLWPCRDKFQVAARANWNAIFGLAWSQCCFTSA